IPQMQVGHLEGALLRLFVRTVRAKRVLEIGTFTGYSALVMAEGLPPDGTLITCDLDPVATEIARKYWSKSPHGRKIQLKLGPSLFPCTMEYWRRSKGEPSSIQSRHAGYGRRHCGQRSPLEAGGTPVLARNCAGLERGGF